ncbi:hypothetical protein, partial [Litorivivens sp.]|uniref:hypothetical protein n=1 Tax=Litorivivens sp. TaxID=2020868 RepID=UPI003563B62E
AATMRSLTGTVLPCVEFFMENLLSVTGGYCDECANPEKNFICMFLLVFFKFTRYILFCKLLTDLHFANQSD